MAWHRTWVNNIIMDPWSSHRCRCVVNIISHFYLMMTSSNRQIFRVTGHLCGNSPAPGEFPAQRPVTQSFVVFFDLHLNKLLSKQWWGWWFETPSRPWRHYNVCPSFRNIWWTSTSYGKKDPNWNWLLVSLVSARNKLCERHPVKEARPGTRIWPVAPFTNMV